MTNHPSRSQARLTEPGGTDVILDIAPALAPLVDAIVNRMSRMARDEARIPRRAKRDWCIDLIATHANGNPLDFVKLLAADDSNFAHDMFGIWQHFDRSTGRLGNHFRPRCSQ